jgi:hypothetical protein
VEWTRFRLGVVAVTVLIFAGCASLGPLGGDQRGVDKATVTERLTETDSYSFEIIQYRQSRTLNESTTLRGTINRTGQLAQFTQTVVTGSASRRRSESRYVFDGTVGYENRDGRWERIDTDRRRWADFDYLRDVTETLEQGELVRLRSETVAGTETTLFRVELPSERADEIVGANQSGHVPRMLEEFDYYVYIDVDTDRLYRMERRAVLTQGARPVTVSVRATFSEQNEPVEITVPEAART